MTLTEQRDQILSRAGFADVEAEVSPRLSPCRSLEYAAAREYYTWAEQVLPFVADAGDARIWRLHADGLPHAEIAQQLGDCPRRVARIVERLRQDLR
jgi:hypothetical protein